MKYPYKELEDGSIAVDIGKLIVDEEDVELASNVYIQIQVQKKNKTGILARRIMNPEKNMEVDHINKNPLDNRKKNLRICTRLENNKNKRKKNSIKHNFKKEKDGSYSYNPGPILIDKEYLYLLNSMYIAVKKSMGTKVCSLCRFILDAPKDMCVDHIDKNTLNNKRSNLRVCTVQQNNCNQKARRGTSIYKGVYFDKKSQKYASSISCNKKTVYLGFFDTEKEAAQHYDLCAKHLHKEFAVLNFPNEILNKDPKDVLNRTKKEHSSKYVGVKYSKKGKRKWIAETRIGQNEGRKYYIGCFYTEEEAHQAYQNYIKKRGD